MRILALMALVILLSSCAQQPDGSGPASPAPGAERASFRIVDDYGGVYRDEKLGAWLTALGQRLAAQSGRPDIAFSFAVLDSGAVNAFSTGDGAIFVTRGLLALCNSESEVAGVVGHEIGHVAAGDRAERSRSNGLRDALTGAFAGFADWAGIAPVPRTRLEFSREQEFNADAFAVRIAAAAGYDPNGLAAILGAIDRAAAGETGQGAPLVAYGETHPLTSERAARALGLAARYPGGRRVGRDAYPRAADGMIYGDSPDQGYVRGGIFIHPKARFLFQLPNGFFVRNTPSALVGARADGSAFVLTSAVPGAAATPYDYLTDVWMTGASLAAPSSIIVNGRSVAIGKARFSTKQGDVDARVAVIGWSPALVYRLIAIGAGGNQTDADRVLSTILGSFRVAAPNDAARLPPLRLKVVTVKSGDTVESLAKAMAVSGDQENAFRRLNGLSPGDRVQPGQQVKRVE